MSQVYKCKLTPEVQKYAEDQLKETEESRRKSFALIKKWAKENPNLHVHPDEKHTLAFLRGCKFDIEKTMTKLRNYYIMRRDRPEWFSNRNPYLQQIQDLVRMGCFIPLKRLSGNQLVVIIRPTVHDPKIYSIDSVLKTGKMLLDIAVLEEELSQIYGITSIIDMKNISFGHAKQLSVSKIQNMIYVWQNNHCRPKRIEFINAPMYINVMLDTFKRFMSDKLKRRTHIHYDGISSLTEVIDKDVLPKDYGGNSETVEELGNYWMQKMISYSDWFKKDEQYKADYECI